jgi:hypothetical protein
LEIDDGMNSRTFMRIVMVMAPFSFPACGGGSTTTPPPTTYSIEGMVSNLSGTGLVLQDNGGNNLPIIANGPFAFTAAVTRWWYLQCHGSDGAFS